MPGDCSRHPPSAWVTPGGQVSVEAGGLDLPQESATNEFPTKGACLENGRTVALQKVLGSRGPRGCLEPVPAVPACVPGPLGQPGANLGRT